jgi:hypothetical protein
MATELRGVYGGPSDDGNFVGAPLPGAVSPSRKVGSDGPDKSAGLCGAPMTQTPHRLDQPRETVRSKTDRATRADVRPK